jgi:NAD(P)-dependent dehydrogenase (short-subunit alcohol dehydrogenase family)
VAIITGGDSGYEDFCREAVGQTLSEFGRIDILINNAAKLGNVNGWL